MSHTTVTMRPIEAAAILELIGIEPHPGSSLVSALSDPQGSTTEQELVHSGLIVEEGSSRRPNAAVGLALATLAQPQETLDLHFAGPAGEKSMAAALVAGHRVVAHFGDDRVEVSFPVNRISLIGAISSSIGDGTVNSVSIDMRISPVGQFLVGTMARHHPMTWESLAEISGKADRDVLDQRSVLGLALLDPSGLDDLYGQPHRAEQELNVLAALDPPVVYESGDGRYILAPLLAEVLCAEPTGSIEATRVRFDDEGNVTDTVTAVRFPHAILATRLSTDGEGRTVVRVFSVSEVELASIVSALLFDDAELAELANVPR